VILKIIDQHPGDHDLTAIWDVWFERVAGGVHLVDLTPTQLTELKQRFDDSYAELIAASGPSGPSTGYGEIVGLSRGSKFADPVLIGHQSRTILNLKWPLIGF